MIRVTVEDIHQPLPTFPPDRRHDDTKAMSVEDLPKPDPVVTVLYLREWPENTPTPDMRALVAHLEGLEYQAICRRCGHRTADHAGFEGACNHGHDGFSHAIRDWTPCDCKAVITDRDELDAEREHHDRLQRETHERLTAVQRELALAKRLMAKMERKLRRNHHVVPELSKREREL